MLSIGFGKIKATFIWIIASTVLFYMGCDSASSKRESYTDQPEFFKLKDNSLLELSISDSDLILVLRPDFPLNDAGQRCATRYGRVYIDPSDNPDATYFVWAQFHDGPQYDLSEDPNQVFPTQSSGPRHYFEIGLQLDTTGNVLEGLSTYYDLNYRKASEDVNSDRGFSLEEFEERFRDFSSDIDYIPIAEISEGSPFPVLEGFVGNFHNGGEWSGFASVNPGCDGRWYIIDEPHSGVELVSGTYWMDFFPYTGETQNGLVCHSFTGRAEVHQDPRHVIATVELDGENPVSFLIAPQPLDFTIHPHVKVYEVDSEETADITDNALIYGEEYDSPPFILFQWGLFGIGQEWELSNGCFGGWTIGSSGP